MIKEALHISFGHKKIMRIEKPIRILEGHLFQFEDHLILRINRSPHHNAIILSEWKILQ